MDRTIKVKLPNANTIEDTRTNAADTSQVFGHTSMSVLMADGLMAQDGSVTSHRNNVSQLTKLWKSSII